MQDKAARGRRDCIYCHRRRRRGRAPRAARRAAVHGRARHPAATRKNAAAAGAAAPRLSRAHAAGWKRARASTGAAATGPVWG
jgi:hypothetical protein